MQLEPFYVNCNFVEIPLAVCCCLRRAQCNCPSETGIAYVPLKNVGQISAEIVEKKCFKHLYDF